MTEDDAKHAAARIRELVTLVDSNPGMSFAIYYVRGAWSVGLDIVESGDHPDLGPAIDEALRLHRNPEI